MLVMLEKKTFGNNREADEIGPMERKWISRITKEVLEDKIPTEFDEDLLRFLSVAGDTYFNHPISKTAQIIGQHGSQPVFEYIYSHQGSFALTDIYRLSLPKLLLKVATTKTEH